MSKYNLIAFTGYGGSGKDEAAKTLIDAGYDRRCFGDIIKKHVDEEVKKKYNFSAFTEKPAEKKKIRALLEKWGEDNYQLVYDEFFTDLPERCVNTRLCRLREAQEWIKRGGIIVAVMRPGVKPETDWARDRFLELQKAGVIFSYLLNDKDHAKLARSVKELFQLDGSKPVVSQPPLPSTPKLATPISAPSAVGARVDGGGTTQAATSQAGPVILPATLTASAGSAPHAEGPKDSEGNEEFVADTVK